MIDFLGDDEFEMMGMGFEEFDFSMDFPLMNPMPASSALSF